MSSKANTHTILLAIFILLAVLPLLAGLVYALLYSLGWIGLLSKGFTLEHWQIFFSSSEAFLSFAYSLYLAFISVSISLGLALALVIGLGDRLRTGALSYLIYLPLGVPAMVAAFFTFQLMGKSGWLSRISYQLAWIQDIQAFPEWIQDSWGIGIISAHIMLALSFFVLLFLNLYHNERVGELGQLARSLGASKRQSQFKVAIPILLNRAYPTILLYGIFVMSSYEIPLVLGRQSPQMISIFTIRNLQHFNLENKPIAFITALVYAGLIMSLLMLLFRGRRLVL